MSNFDKPTAVDGLDATFGRINGLLPPMSSIPDRYSDKSFWEGWQSKWFFSGLEKNDIPKPKDGIDAKAAMAHLAAIQRSFEPKHEHKQAAVAWLASNWFVKP